MTALPHAMTRGRFGTGSRILVFIRNTMFTYAQSQGRNQRSWQGRAGSAVETNAVFQSSALKCWANSLASGSFLEGKSLRKKNMSPFIKGVHFYFIFLQFCSIFIQVPFKYDFQITFLHIKVMSNCGCVISVTNLIIVSHNANLSRSHSEGAFSLVSDAKTLSSGFCCSARWQIDPSTFDHT